MEEKKMVAIRSFPVNTWKKIRQIAIEEDKTISQWLTEVIERYLKREKKE